MRTSLMPRRHRRLEMAEGLVRMRSIALPEPPPLPAPARTGLTARLDAPLAAGVGTILATVAARMVIGGTPPMAECHWLRWTGIPCPGCGGTRCLAAVSYTHLRAHETPEHLVCRLLLEKKKK